MMEAGLIPQKERPKHTGGTSRIDHCRHYRREIVREIGERLVKIQDGKWAIERVCVFL